MSVNLRPQAPPRGEEPAAARNERLRRHWRANLRLTAGLLAIWFVVTFGTGWFARDLDFNFFGWPFSFWVGSQGALIVYVLITWYYARRMAGLDEEHDVAERD